MLAGYIYKPKQNLYFLLWFSVLFPIAYIVVRKYGVYDGIRHILFILPPMSCILGLGLKHGIAWISSKNKQMFFMSSVVIAIYFVYHVGIMLKLHPYETVYFNSLTGGCLKQSNVYKNLKFFGSLKPFLKKRFQEKRYAIF